MDNSTTTNHPETGQATEQARETVQKAANTAATYGSRAADHYVKEPAQDLFSLAKSYAKDHPDVAACWAFAFGVVVGWKIKP
ncbi:hypothetical protein [Crateriforma conspicua]|uniref:Uncharacterized protein n=1 Tax=Crateriforma conspicua TaxID=2527996 RepID=A0A5C6G0X2_9PLAN|nr:hypothetical protein [Crateriforma conspicua]TWU67130.1 hypothetical protein V7x_27030 [Crateriforma conspicua]